MIWKFFAKIRYSTHPCLYPVFVMGVAQHGNAPQNPPAESGKESASATTVPEASMEQSSSGGPGPPGVKRRRGNPSRDSTHNRGGGDRRNKRKDMGRSEWRYIDLLLSLGFL